VALFYCRKGGVRVDESQEKLEDRVDKIEDELNTLKTRVSVVETNVSTILAQLADIKSNTTWLLRLVLGIIIASILALIFKDSGALAAIML
jgi:archaellum component FlaC